MKIFTGATDSAVPCAMLINLAQQMVDLLPSATPDVSLKFVFFDGEEAFKQWSSTDSIYGARHLAKILEQQISIQYNENVNELHRMDLLVLLDLLGAPDPKFYSYFSETERWYLRLSDAEERLAEMGQLKGHSQWTYFARKSLNANIQDDHIPFLQRAVHVLHIIPSPFPDFWHTPEDNRKNINMHTIENLNKIFRVFVTEYLHVKV